MSDLSMKPTRDELVSRRGPVKRASGNKGGGFGWKLLVATVLLVLAGAAAYLWNTMQQLDSALNESLKASQEQLGTLQSKVQTQDKSLSMTGDKVTSSINSLNAEVKKLWDLSNKRNRPDIELLQKNLQALQKKVEDESKARAELTSQLTEAQTEAKTFRAELAKLQVDVKKDDKIKTLQDTVASLKNQQQSLAEAQSSLQSTQESLQSKLTKQQSQLAGIGKAPAAPPAASDLGRRIGEVEADILSINAHRQQVNSRLNQLDQDIQGLYQRR